MILILVNFLLVKFFWLYIIERHHVIKPIPHDHSENRSVFGFHFWNRITLYFSDRGGLVVLTAGLCLPHAVRDSPGAGQQEHHMRLRGARTPEVHPEQDAEVERSA